MNRKERQQPRRRNAPLLLPTLPALAAVYEANPRPRHHGAIDSLNSKPASSASASRSSPPRRRTASSDARTLPPLRTRDAEEALRERRKQEAMQRRQEVLAQRLEALVLRQEREARADVALAEKTAWHSIVRRANADALRVHTADAASPEKAAPDAVLCGNAVLAQGAPARSRRLCRGVGLGIGAVMHAVDSPSPYGSASPALARTAGPTAAVYRAHDMRTDKSRAMSKPRYPQPASPRAQSADSSIAVYEVRLLTVREAQQRAALEADGCTKLQWLYDAEFRARLVALDRARHAAVAAADGERRRKQLVDHVAATAVDAAVRSVADGYRAADEAAEAAITRALKARKRDGAGA